jgi:hypothetical protein
VPDFSIECFYNEYLPAGSSDVDVVITITATDAGTGGASGGPADSPGCVVIIVDVSGSMGGQRIRQARKATSAAIACLPEGTRFAVVAGNEMARPVYPQFGLAVATPEARAAASHEVAKLEARGGTRIGRWIRATTKLLAEEKGPRQALLLTDGKNENESAEDLDDALADAAGVFRCDCRGVGEDWVVSELRRVSSSLLGSLSLVADASALTADFEQVIRAATSRGVAEMSLRIWSPEGAEAELSQVTPDRIPLSGSEAAGLSNTKDFLTGAWGDESRDFHLTVRFRPAEVGSRMLAARVSLLLDGEPLLAGERAVQRLVTVEWTDDAALSTRINKQVAHYKGQEELAVEVGTGLQALEDGDEGTAVVHLRKAVALASELGDREMSRRLKRIVEVEDASTGIIVLRKKVQKSDLMDAEVQTTKTTRVPK